MSDGLHASRIIKLLTAKGATLALMSARRPGWLIRAVEGLIRRSLEQALAVQAERLYKHRKNSLAGDGISGHSAPVLTNVAKPISSAVTQGISVTVQSTYLPDQSSPKDDRYVFAYTVSIENRGTATAQLRTRHWVITDARGSIDEVRGDGVIGEQPKLSPGQSFQYTSGCVLNTSIGTMQGSYRMWRDDGSYFDADIAPFSLVTPARKSDAMMN
jgi:ApaG protein